jgi:hypothetical protein
LQDLRRVLKAYGAIPPYDDGLELNACFAREEFGLDEVDTQILLLLLRYERNSDLEQFADEVLQRLHSPARAVAALLGIDSREARHCMMAGSPLIASGLVCLSEDGFSSGLAGHSGYLQLARPLRKVIQRLMDRLDQASLRRFTLKLRFEPLTPAQATLAFEHFFGTVPPRRLTEGLTPGDFATVCRKRDLFGAADPSLLADWLGQEAEAKGTRTRPIGFAAACR